MTREQFDLLRARITNWATSRLRSRQDAEDFAQDVLLELTRKYPDKTDLEDLLPLAYRILELKLNNAIRKRIRRKEDANLQVDELPLGAEGDDPEQSFLGRERRKLLFQAIDRLGQQCRELLHLQLSGLPQKTISERLGQPDGTIYARSSRCRKKLKEEINKLSARQRP